MQSVGAYHSFDRPGLGGNSGVAASTRHQERCCGEPRQSPCQHGNLAVTGFSQQCDRSTENYRSTASNLRFAILTGMIVASTHSTAAAPNPNTISIGDVGVPYSRAER